MMRRTVNGEHVGERGGYGLVDEDGLARPEYFQRLDQVLGAVVRFQHDEVALSQE